MTRQVPGPAADNNDRITGRSYEGGFAGLPADEVADIPAPGAGPRGSVDDGPRVPLVVMALGALVAFSTFFVRSPWTLAFGLAVVVAGAVWSAVGTPHPGAGAGSGPAQFDDDT